MPESQLKPFLSNRFCDSQFVASQVHLAQPGRRSRCA